jgi:glycerol-3-phosphate acyltransferase PlsX
MRIVLDAMGSDQRPVPDVAGAVMAARDYGDTIILVGNKPTVTAELAKHNTRGLSIEIVHADEQIGMDEKPSYVVSHKPASSIHVGLSLVKAGQADGFVTMGNTGATHAIATLKTLRRIPGVLRPALTAIYGIDGHNMIFLDIGANADVKAEYIEQFALMGSLYAQTALNIPAPRVGTLSNGEEEGKGNSLTKESQERLRASAFDINYVGHIEPKEILLNRCDVVVMDGFVGNIFLKTFEGSMSYMAQLIRKEVSRSLLYQLGALMMRGAFKALRRQLDTREIGGAPLLGVNGVVIIGHGGADAVAVKNAINQARRAIAGNTIRAMTEQFAKLTSRSTQALES